MPGGSDYEILRAFLFLISDFLKQLFTGLRLRLKKIGIPDRALKCQTRDVNCS